MPGYEEETWRAFNTRLESCSTKVSANDKCRNLEESDVISFRE